MGIERSGGPSEKRLLYRTEKKRWSRWIWEVLPSE